MKPILTAAMIQVLCTTAVQGDDFHVAPSGNDAQPGTAREPFATLARAQRAARQAAGRGPVRVILRGGTYHLPATLVFTPEDSGTAQAPVVYTAASGEEVVLSGGVRLDLQWAPYRDGIRQAKVPAGLTADQLFVNGRRQHLARYPNFDPAVRHFNGYAADAFSPQRAARWADPRGGFIHAMHRAEWGDFHYCITGKGVDNQVTYDGGWQNNRRMGMHGTFRMVENIFEELDAPGEWFLRGDRAAAAAADPPRAVGRTIAAAPEPNTLYFFPPPDLDLAHATVEAVRLRHLVEFRGTVETPVRFVTLQGLTFRHAARTFMDNREPLLRSDWTTYRGGAVFFQGTEDCAVEDCFLDQLGGNAIFVSNYNRRLVIRGCHIARAGANGVAFVGNPQAVRNPLFEYGERQRFDQIDMRPGPQSPDYPAECLVEDCLIYQTGRVEKQTAPVQIAMAQDITVRHCSLYDVPRAGINIGDGCWGGHVIEHCDVFDTVRETGDHGSFNSWGRDRYWGLQGIDLNTVTLGEHRDLPRLDAVKPTVLRNNRWRCDHGWDIDLDDGSTNYEIRNNLCLNGGIKLREGFCRICENNIMVNNSFHPHVWYGNSQDVFRHNIVFGAYRPIRVGQPWGRECDRNLLHKPGLTEPAPATGFRQQSGLDANSLEADARFIQAAGGDYRVQEGSPAVKLGFQNFPMDQFGVRKPALKSLARTPELPDPHAAQSARRPARDGRVSHWLGAQVKNVVGLGEVSAAGLPGEAGVALVEVPADSRLAKAGLRATDIILKCGRESISTVSDLRRAWRAAAPHGTVPLEIWREQKSHAVEVAGGEIVLSPADAQIRGAGPHPVYDANKDFLGAWTNPAAFLEWKVAVAKPGAYAVCITLANPAAGNEFELQLGEQKLTGSVPRTGSWEQFVTQSLGTVKFATGGEWRAVLRPTKVRGAVMNVRSVDLLPTR
jgi:hypothetical protein